MLALRVLWLKSLDLTVGVFRSHYKTTNWWDFSTSNGLLESADIRVDKYLLTVDKSGNKMNQQWNPQTMLTFGIQ